MSERAKNERASEKWASEQKMSERAENERASEKWASEKLASKQKISKFQRVSKKKPALPNEQASEHN